LVRRELQVLAEGANAEPGVGCEHSKREERVQVGRDDQALGHEPVDPIVPSALTVSGGCIGIAVREAPTHVAIW